MPRLLPLSLACALVALAPELQAHRLDEYLQATRIAVSTEQIVIELDLTPGAAVAASVFAAIDQNRDGHASPEEGLAYARQVVEATTLEVDGMRQPLTLLSSEIPDVAAMQAGMGTVRLAIGGGGASNTPGAHELTFRNSHRDDVGVYLINALTPATPRVRITGQRRDVVQGELQLSYDILPHPTARWPPWWTAGIAGIVVCASGLARRHWRRQHAPGVAHTPVDHRAQDGPQVIPFVS